MPPVDTDDSTSIDGSAERSIKPYSKFAKPSHIVRSIYALPLNVHKNDLGLKLDLSYIMPNLIVCSYPVTKYPKMIYRNSLQDLVTFLNKRHGRNNWRIYNLKIEKSKSDYTNEDLWNIALQGTTFHKTSVTLNSLKEQFSTNNIAGNIYTKKSSPAEHALEENTTITTVPPRLKGLLRRVGWLDHAPPPFLLMQEILDDMHEFLSFDENRATVLHCRMGKGRSGTMVAAYMMKYMGFTMDDALEIFMISRFKPGTSQGVTMASQLRYLKYHELFLSHSNEQRLFHIRNLNRQPDFLIKQIKLIDPSGILYTHPCSATIQLQIYNNERDGYVKLTTLKTDDELLSANCNSDIVLNFPLKLNVSDLRLEFGFGTAKSKFAHRVTSFASYSYCWLNLYWEVVKIIAQNNVNYCDISTGIDAGQKFTFHVFWKDLEGVKGSPNKGYKLFESMEISWVVL